MKTRPDAAGIAAAVDALLAGDVIGLPTETVYGLAADAGQGGAVAQIYRIKGRPSDHPLIVHVLDQAVAARWAVWNERAERLARAFWPGPMTLVLPRRPGAPAHACAAETTIALRVPAHPVARAVMAEALARGIEGIAAPSANRYGRVSPTRASHIEDDLGDAVAVVLDGGDCEVGIESTIIDLSGPALRIRRPGGLDAAALLAVAEGSVLADAALSPHAGPATASRDGFDIDETDGDTGNDRDVAATARTEVATTTAVGIAATPVPRVPGDRHSHYAPLTRTVVIDAEQLDDEIRNRRRAGQRVAVWSVKRPAADANAPSPDGLVWRQRSSDPIHFARELYAGMRELDQLRCDVIVIEQPPADPVWAAVNDRLARASAP